MINKSIILLWLLILCSVTQVRSQSILETYLNLSKNKSFSNSEAVIDTLLNNDSETTHSEVLKLINHISLDRFKAKDYSNCIKYSLIELVHYEKANSPNEAIIETLHRLGVAYYKIKDYTSSITYHRKTIALDSLHLKTAISYSEIGKNYYRLGDFFKAETYHKTAIKKLESERNFKTLLNVYFALIRVYIRFESKDGQIGQLDILQKAEALKSKITFSPRQHLILNNYFAGYYNSIYSYDFDKSKSYYLKNFDLAEKVKDTAYLCATCINLGDIHNEGKRQGAIPYLKKSLEYCEDNILYYTYHQMGFAYLNNDELKKALEYMDKSINILTSSNTDSKSFSADDLKHILDKLNLMLAFERKAEILLKSYKKDHNTKHVEDALEQLTLIDEFIDAIENNTSEEQSQLHWRNEASKAYSKAIECANILERPDLAFYFNEKSKALLLTESILSNAMQVSLPKDVSEKENAFKKNILKLENELADNTNPIAVKDNLFALKFEYQKFSDSLKLTFPEYYSNKSKTQLYSLDTIKKQLDNNTLVISYNWDMSEDDKSIIHGLAFNRSLTQHFTIENTTEIKTYLKIYRALLSRPHDTKKDSDDFKYVAYTLFKSLFPIDIEQQLKGKHLLIIPDGNLQNIPFEALITEESSDAYLIKSNAISYAYSMSFLLHNASVKRDTKNDFLGFAPITFDYKGLGNLDKSEAELNAIHEIIGGDKYLKTNANKTTFLEHGSDSKIVHLATHAQVSSDPWVAFSDEPLKLHELYTHKINADLVVLSACNTSVGEQYQGEGVFSLARGFFYCGANSVISSHWSANDSSTSTIMQNFYSNLKKGESKSNALRNAQLSYLKTNTLSQASPYYWASFVLVGNFDHVNFDTNSYLYVLLILFFIMLLIFLFSQKNKFKK